MNTINDGGTAFPVRELNGNGRPEMTGFGMTLRDYFAAKAMQSMLLDTKQFAGCGLGGTIARCCPRHHRRLVLPHGRRHAQGTEGRQ